MRIEVTKQIEIAAAHYQPGYPGKCRNLHGHNYKVELTAVGDPDGLDAYGMLIDFSTMSEHLEQVVGVWDHAVLNNLVDRPSIECIAMNWLTSLRAIEGSNGYPFGHIYKKLTVWENDRSSCTVYADDYLV
jgi:6-pyruvoyltetrahydropterin/6-carboxytetrahydropterin synthase